MAYFILSYDHPQSCTKGVCRICRTCQTDSGQYAASNCRSNIYSVFVMWSEVLIFIMFQIFDTDHGDTAHAILVSDDEVKSPIGLKQK